MGHIHQIPTRIDFSPKPAERINASISFSPDVLIQSGFSLPVTVSVPASIASFYPDVERQSFTVMAHLDTGATISCIDKRLAARLGLAPVSMSCMNTASGPSHVPNFVVDVSFPYARLQPFPSLMVSSCTLPFDESKTALSSRNFAVLIGRDMMSRWNIVWNGPTSTVFISD